MDPDPDHELRSCSKRRKTHEIGRELYDKNISREWVPALNCLRWVCHTCTTSFRTVREASHHTCIPEADAATNNEAEEIGNEDSGLGSDAHHVDDTEYAAGHEHDLVGNMGAAADAIVDGLFADPVLLLLHI